MERWKVDRSSEPAVWAKEPLTALSTDKPLLTVLDEEIRREDTEYRWIVFNRDEEAELARIAALLFPPAGDPALLVLDGVVHRFRKMWAGPFVVAWVREDGPGGYILEEGVPRLPAIQFGGE